MFDHNTGSKNSILQRQINEKVNLFKSYWLSFWYSKKY